MTLTKMHSYVDGSQNSPQATKFSYKKQYSNQSGFIEYNCGVRLNAKVGRDDVLKSTIGNESLHEISNDNLVRVEILPHLKVSLSNVQCSHIATFINILGHLQMETPKIRLTIP
jgi:hypothetical protein